MASGRAAADPNDRHRGHLQRHAGRRCYCQHPAATSPPRRTLPRLLGPHPGHHRSAGHIQRAVHDAGGDLALVRTEPACWRSWTTPGGGLAWLKPDLEIITRTAGGDEDHWLLEIDLGTENPARLITKCHDYQAHVNTEIHQTRYGYYPQVVWVMNEQRHEEWLRQHIADDPRLTTALFKAIGSEEELEIIVQAEL